MIETTGLSQQAMVLVPMLEALSAKDRELLGDYLLATSIDPDRGSTAPLAATVKKRLDELRSGKVAGVPAEEVEGRLRQRFQ